MLVVFSGLPGTGKTTLAQAFAQQRHALYLGSDTIDLALRLAASISGESSPIVHGVAKALALENLRLAQIVVIDSVNALQARRDAWRQIAVMAQVQIFEIEMICSNAAEHQRRIEARTAGPESLIPPTWQDVKERHYDAWDRPHLVIDSAELSFVDAYKGLVNWLQTGASTGPIAGGAM